MGVPTDSCRDPNVVGPSSSYSHYTHTLWHAYMSHITCCSNDVRFCLLAHVLSSCPNESLPSGRTTVSSPNRSRSYAPEGRHLFISVDFASHMVTLAVLNVVQREREDYTANCTVAMTIRSILRSLLLAVLSPPSSYSSLDAFLYGHGSVHTESTGLPVRD